jgi:hypothetical protein
MSILSRSALKAEFVSGTAATQQKFEDIFDSSYNKNDESVLMGPVGMTGTLGLWYSDDAAPVSSGATGLTGQTILGSSGPTAYMYVHNGTQWFKFEGSSSF